MVFVNNGVEILTPECFSSLDFYSKKKVDYNVNRYGVTYIWPYSIIATTALINVLTILTGNE